MLCWEGSLSKWVLLKLCRAEVHYMVDICAFVLGYQSCIILH
jgi:hypothetical protein